MMSFSYTLETDISEGGWQCGSEFGARVWSLGLGLGGEGREGREGSSPNTSPEGTWMRVPWTSCVTATAGMQGFSPTQTSQPRTS